ncbi:hypothetical protein B0H10DRAFT_1806119, partial [Mycena sp. CBHHK59/15]
PPFSIPDIRFVHAGVAVIHQQVPGPVLVNKSSICWSYLIEELIDEPQDGFYKFINNSSAILLPTANEVVAAVAGFLSFTQHVQYYKMDGMVYLSDLQGTTKLLTDPQIMTAPDGAEIFGEGNVPAAFKAFLTEHVCNKFCRWFELPALQPTNQ